MIFFAAVAHSANCVSSSKSADQLGNVNKFSFLATLQHTNQPECFYLAVLFQS
jgi:hypothetical protein